jgi:hypothetical protein
MALYAPVSQETVAISSPFLASLPDGNLLLVYRDDDDGDKGKSVVFDGTGRYVAGPTTIVADGVKEGWGTDIRVIAHGSGRPVVSYVSKVDGTGYFATLDNTGAVTAGPTQYMNDPSLYLATGVAGGGGNSLFLASGRGDYPFASQQGGSFAIHDISDGSVVKAVTEFNDGGSNDETRGAAASLHRRGPVFFLYTQGWSSLTPRFVIYDEAGTVQVADSAFATTKANTYQVVKLGNGNAFVSYVDLNDSYKGKFAVYDSAGALAVGATAFADLALNNDYLAATVTGDGYVFIAYSDSTDGKQAKYVVHDGTGALVTAATDLSSGAAYPYSAAKLSNDSIPMVSFLSGNVYSLQYLAGN